MDTLSKSLDIDSIEWGASSHPYRAEVIDKRTLRFTFDNINLVDSNRNELKSHGYVKFRVKQKKNVVIGTEITNRAAIYFDYNAPVMTNTTRHIVGKLDDIPLCNSRIPICNTVKTEDITLLKAKIIVSPNPFSETTTVHIETEYPLSNWTFELYNVIGKHLRTEKFTDNALLFERKDLPNGFYIFRILSEGKWIGSGKISVTH